MLKITKMVSLKTTYQNSPLKIPIKYKKAHICRALEKKKRAI